MKKTKIICTLGPASDTEVVLSDLIDAGMNVARLNFSHGTHEDHAKKIAMIKKLREEKKHLSLFFWIRKVPNSELKPLKRVKSL